MASVHSQQAHGAEAHEAQKRSILLQVLVLLLLLLEVLVLLLLLTPSLSCCRPPPRSRPTTIPRRGWQPS